MQRYKGHSCFPTTDGTGSYVMFADAQAAIDAATKRADDAERRLELVVAEVKAWRSGQLRLRLLLVPNGVGEAFYAAFGDTNIWDATNADPVLAKMIGGGE